MNFNIKKAVRMLLEFKLFMIKQEPTSIKLSSKNFIIIKKAFRMIFELELLMIKWKPFSVYLPRDVKNKKQAFRMILEKCGPLN